MFPVGTYEPLFCMCIQKNLMHTKNLQPCRDPGLSSGARRPDRTFLLYARRFFVCTGPDLRVLCMHGPDRTFFCMHGGFFVCTGSNSARPWLGPGFEFNSPKIAGRFLLYAHTKKVVQMVLTNGAPFAPVD